MFAYLGKRLLATVPVLLVVAGVVFLLVRLAPGDPASMAADDLATEDDIAKIRAQMGLDRPIGVQFAGWLWRLLQGDFGTSLLTGMPVTQLIGQRLEATASLAAATLALSVLLAIPLGTLAAYRAGSWVDRLTMFGAVAAFSVPGFLLGYLLVWVFSVQLEWLPVQGYRSLAEGAGPWLQHLVLPAVTMALIFSALLARITRTTVLDVLQEDYIRTARAKGLGVVAVLVHALRMAAVPIVTTIGVGMALLIGGVVVIESVFSIPGVGRLAIDAVQRHDYPVIQGVLLMSALAYVLINLAVDMSYALFDPRIRY
jgi:peptide/nickel transport system permease protein